MRSRLYGDTNASEGEAVDVTKMHAQLDEIERELKKHQDAYGARDADDAGARQSHPVRYGKEVDLQQYAQLPQEVHRRS